LFTPILPLPVSLTSPLILQFRRKDQILTLILPPLLGGILTVLKLSKTEPNVLETFVAQAPWLILLFTATLVHKPPGYSKMKRGKNGKIFVQI